MDILVFLCAPSDEDLTLIAGAVVQYCRVETCHQSYRNTILNVTVL